MGDLDKCNHQCPHCCPPETDPAEDERLLAKLRETAAGADPGLAARLLAHVDAQAAQLPVPYRDGRAAPIHPTIQQRD